MPHKFVVLIDGVLQTFSRVEDIPQVIDNLIEFVPEMPPPPHIDHDHDNIHQWNEVLKELLSRERL